MTALVVTNGGRGFRIEAHCRNQLKKNKLMHYFHFNSHFKQLHASNKIERFSYKGQCGGCGHHTLIVYLKEKVA